MNAETQRIALNAVGRAIGGFLYYETMTLIAMPWIPGYTLATSLIVACFVGPYVAIAFADQHRQFLERLGIFVRPGQESCSFGSSVVDGMRTSSLISLLFVPFSVFLSGAGSLLFAALLIVLDKPQSGVPAFVNAMDHAFWLSGIYLNVALLVGGIFWAVRLIVSRVRPTPG